MSLRQEHQGDHIGFAVVCDLCARKMVASLEGVPPCPEGWMQTPACRKKTWLYAVGIDLRGPIRLRGRLSCEPTHVLGRDRRRKTQSELPEASHEIRRRTPIAFAQWLLELAAGARVPS